MTALAVNREETRWSVTFANPRANVVDPEMTLELEALVDELEHDPDVVVVFGSAYPDHFLGRPDHEQHGGHGRDPRRRRRAATRLINRGGFA